MNSLSNCHNNEKSSDYEEHKDYDKHCSHPIPGKLLITCSNANLGPMGIFVTSPPFIQILNLPLASVTIDATCLESQNLLINFTGILTDIPNIIQSIGTLISTFTFTLFKSYKGTPIRQPVATFDFNFTLLLGLGNDSRTLIFDYSSCDEQCEDYCIYTLELTSFSNTTTVSTTILINGTLCALIVDSSH